MVKIFSDRVLRNFTIASSLFAFGITGCTTTPEPVVEEPEVTKIEDLVVQIYEPEPEPVQEVPSIDIAEYERQQAEKAEALRAAQEALEPEPEPVPAPAPKPVVKKTLEERLADAKTPGDKISILRKEPESDNINQLMILAYEEKLAADKASGDNAGAAEALVFLGQVEAEKGVRDSDVSALEKYAEALTLNPDNSEAPRLVSQMRGKLQTYSDSLHKAAVSFFVKQDFSPAISRWEKVLLIDPGNNAARNWYNQAIEAVKR